MARPVAANGNSTRPSGLGIPEPERARGLRPEESSTGLRSAGPCTVPGPSCNGLAQVTASPRDTVQESAGTRLHLEDHGR